MIYRIRFLKDIRYPQTFFYQLKNAEIHNGFWSRFSLLALVSIAISFIYAYYGIGTEAISKEIYQLSGSEFEMKKAIFAAGKLLFGLVYPFLIVFLPSLFFWSVTDGSFKKIAIIQVFVLLIVLIEKALFIPFAISLGIHPESSPFTLGVIMQYITNADILIYFFGMISIFKVLAMVLQYFGLKELTSKEPIFIFWMVMAINGFFWLVSALLSYIKIENLL
ncbi:hypothetical protein [Cytobacillus massiliigabonensis]|uniref:hypothetical protein n=1 Tax=Cytobacillus massiliigabonensis TaxID=1871011 RepID=UPI000C81CCFB|nr:hypothetical protein [Cytobacillus massiliigabonensis]